MYNKPQVKRYDSQMGQKLFSVMRVTFSNGISVICVINIAKGKTSGAKFLCSLPKDFLLHKKNTLVE